jgi:hypothetical protein
MVGRLPHLSGKPDVEPTSRRMTESEPKAELVMGVELFPLNFIEGSKRDEFV